MKDLQDLSVAWFDASQDLMLNEFERETFRTCSEELRNLIGKGV